MMRLPDWIMIPTPTPMAVVARTAPRAPAATVVAPGASVPTATAVPAVGFARPAFVATESAAGVVQAPDSRCCTMAVIFRGFLAGSVQPSGGVVVVVWVL